VLAVRQEDADRSLRNAETAYDKKYKDPTVVPATISILSIRKQSGVCMYLLSFLLYCFYSCSGFNTPAAGA